MATKAMRKLNNEFLKACSTADAKKMKELLKQHVDPAYVRDIKSGLTALMQCAKYEKENNEKE